MKRFSEKVKDIVEVRSYETLTDLLSEPSRTVANYHFSDATTDLMVRWLDDICNPVPGAKCRAIAGYRGVGKSHFLAMVSVLASHPEVRSLITETHVASASQRLLRRHYPVINVRRGLLPTLKSELIAAVASTFAIEESTVGSEITDILAKAKELSGDLRTILLIDTASDRSSPVERNDGDVLSVIASESSKLGIFTGLALDDDIANADGSNLAVSSSFAIDYLDPEHLHKVVNSLIFPKHSRMQSVLSNVYAHFRETVPQFRWSEQKFAAMYPLHPATLELAPFIRAYVPDFALLGFASEAGQKILGRPVDSLIGFEEIFDNTEPELRKVDEISGAFAAYDDLTTKQIGKLPVTDRHRAKLILKTLFLLSLTGRSSTADDIAGAMMFVDPADQAQVSFGIEAALAAFSQSNPETISVESSGPAIAYSLRVGSNKLARELEALTSEISESEIQKIYLRAVAARFPEVAVSTSGGEDTWKPVMLTAKWRGTVRAGRMQIVVSDTLEDAKVLDGPKPDWELTFRAEEPEQDRGTLEKTALRIDWVVAPLTVDESRTLAAFQVLKTNADLRTKYSDQLSALLQTRAKAVETAVERTSIADARLVIDGFDYNFSDDAREATNLSDMMSVMLEPLFESLYYEHPIFKELLTDEVVESFLRDVLGSQSNSDANARHLLATFGAPLGLTDAHTDTPALKTKDELSRSDNVVRILDLVDASPGTPLRLDAAADALAASPLGLSRQAVRLVLAAMAVNGLVEFITVGNERIRGRSLDLKVDWDQIEFLSRPSTTRIEAEKLTRWARLIAGDESIVSMTRPEDRLKVLGSLNDISADWQNKNSALVRSSIPECDLNTRLWSAKSRVLEEYTEIVSMIDETLAGDIDLDLCIEKISKALYDRPEYFHSMQYSLSTLEHLEGSYFNSKKIQNYLALTENTGIEEVEQSKASVWKAIDAVQNEANEQTVREVGYAWTKFLRLYSEYYSSKHNALQSPGANLNWFENTTGPNRWRVFIAAMECESVRAKFGRSFRSIKRELASFQCSEDPPVFLTVAPMCVCALRSADLLAVERLAEEINYLVDEVFEHFEKLVNDNRELLLSEIESEMERSSRETDQEIYDGLLQVLRSGLSIPEITNPQLELLCVMLSGIKADEEAPDGGLGWMHSIGSSLPATL